MSFDNLGLSAELLRAVSDQGYSTPTPIQAQAIPVVLEGRDVLGGAQTGTGKTAGFTLPLLQRLSAKPAANGYRPVRALVLTPTRELAAQVGESVTTYGKHLSMRSSVIFGGVKINPQIATLRRGVDILVATPGRLLDHVGQKTLDLSQVEILVLDEADRMLDMGFIHDIRKVLALLPKQRQNLLFSATFSEEIKQLADNLLDSPVLIEVARRNTAAESVSQVAHHVDKGRKRELLSFLIGSQNWKQVLVFTRTKHGANRLAKQLEQDGIGAAAIHGNKSQGARTRALADFKAGSVRVLVATDIAARGLDIDQLPHVVNYELPNVPEDYVHRIGRTGRAGREGEAVSLVCVDELRLLRDIERVLKREVPKVAIEGYDIDPSIKAEPIQNGQNRGAGRNDRGRSGNARANNGNSARRSAPRNQEQKPRRAASQSANGNSQGANRGNGNTGNTQSASRGNGNSRNEPNGNRAPSANGNSQSGNRAQGNNGNTQSGNRTQTNNGNRNHGNNAKSQNGNRGNGNVAQQRTQANNGNSQRRRSSKGSSERCALTGG